MSVSSLSKIITPIASRCLALRIASPTDDEIKSCLKYIIKKCDNDAETVYQKVVDLFEGKIKTVRIGKYEIESADNE